MNPPGRTACLVGLVGFALVGLPAARASARDVWSAPHPGIRHLHRTGEGPGLHVVTVDLQHPELDLVTSSAREPAESTAAFAARNDAYVALGAHLAPGAWSSPEAPWMLRDGRALVAPAEGSIAPAAGPQSAAGLTGDRRTLVLLTVETAPRGGARVDPARIVETLREFGATEAVALDAAAGGGLVLAGVAAHPGTAVSGPGAGGHVGARVRPGAGWWSGEVLAHGGAADVAPGDVAELWVEARNTGRRPWRTVFEGGGSPVLELDDGLHRFTASVTETTYPGEVGRFVLRWVSESEGRRGLGARLSLPDGEAMVEAPVRFDVAVRSTAETPDPEASPTPPRSGPMPVATAGLGCSAKAPGTPAPAAWAGLAALTAAGVLARRRRRAG